MMLNNFNENTSVYNSNNHADDTNLKEPAAVLPQRPSAVQTIEPIRSTKQTATAHLPPTAPHSWGPYPPHQLDGFLNGCYQTGNPHQSMYAGVDQYKSNPGKYHTTPHAHPMQHDYHHYTAQYPGGTIHHPIPVKCNEVCCQHLTDPPRYHPPPPPTFQFPPHHIQPPRYSEYHHHHHHHNPTNGISKQYLYNNGNKKTKSISSSGSAQPSNSGFSPVHSDLQSLPKYSHHHYHQVTANRQKELKQPAKPVALETAAYPVYPVMNSYWASRTWVPPPPPYHQAVPLTQYKTKQDTANSIHCPPAFQAIERNSTPTGNINEERKGVIMNGSNSNPNNSANNSALGGMPKTVNDYHEKSTSYRTDFDLNTSFINSGFPIVHNSTNKITINNITTTPLRPPHSQTRNINLPCQLMNIDKQQIPVVQSELQVSVSETSNLAQLETSPSTHCINVLSSSSSSSSPNGGNFIINESTNCNPINYSISNSDMFSNNIAPIPENMKNYENQNNSRSQHLTSNLNALENSNRNMLKNQSDLDVRQFLVSWNDTDEDNTRVPSEPLSNNHVNVTISECGNSNSVNNVEEERLAVNVTPNRNCTNIKSNPSWNNSAVQSRQQQPAFKNNIGPVMNSVEPSSISENSSNYDITNRIFNKKLNSNNEICMSAIPKRLTPLEGHNNLHSSYIESYMDPKVNANEKKALIQNNNICRNTNRIMHETCVDKSSHFPFYNGFSNYIREKNDADMIENAAFYTAYNEPSSQHSCPAAIRQHLASWEHINNTINETDHSSVTLDGKIVSTSIQKEGFERKTNINVVEPIIPIPNRNSLIFEKDMHDKRRSYTSLSVLNEEPVGNFYSDPMIGAMHQRPIIDNSCNFIDLSNSNNTGTNCSPIDNIHSNVQQSFAHDRAYINYKTGVICENNPNKGIVSPGIPNFHDSSVLRIPHQQITSKTDSQPNSNESRNDPTSLKETGFVTVDNGHKTSPSNNHKKSLSVDIPSINFTCPDRNLDAVDTVMSSTISTSNNNNNNNSDSGNENSICNPSIVDSMRVETISSPLSVNSHCNNSNHSNYADISRKVDEEKTENSDSYSPFLNGIPSSGEPILNSFVPENKCNNKENNTITLHSANDITTHMTVNDCSTYVQHYSEMEEKILKNDSSPIDGFSTKTLNEDENNDSCSATDKDSAIKKVTNDNNNNSNVVKMKLNNRIIKKKLNSSSFKLKRLPNKEDWAKMNHPIPSNKSADNCSANNLPKDDTASVSLLVANCKNESVLSSERRHRVERILSMPSLEDSPDTLNNNRVSEIDEEIEGLIAAERNSSRQSIDCNNDVNKELGKPYINRDRLHNTENLPVESTRDSKFDKNQVTAQLSNISVCHLSETQFTNEPDSQINAICNDNNDTMTVDINVLKKKLNAVNSVQGLQKPCYMNSSNIRLQDSAGGEGERAGCNKVNSENVSCPGQIDYTQTSESSCSKFSDDINSSKCSNSNLKFCNSPSISYFKLNKNNSIENHHHDNDADVDEIDYDEERLISSVECTPGSPNVEELFEDINKPREDFAKSNFSLDLKNSENDKSDDEFHSKPNCDLIDDLKINLDCKINNQESVIKSTLNTVESNLMEDDYGNNAFNCDNNCTVSPVTYSKCFDNTDHVNTPARLNSPCTSLFNDEEFVAKDKLSPCKYDEKAVTSENDDDKVTFAPTSLSLPSNENEDQNDAQKKSELTSQIKSPISTVYCASENNAIITECNKDTDNGFDIDSLCDLNALAHSHYHKFENSNKCDVDRNDSDCKNSSTKVENIIEVQSNLQPSISDDLNNVINLSKAMENPIKLDSSETADVEKVKNNSEFHSEDDHNNKPQENVRVSGVCQDEINTLEISKINSPLNETVKTGSETLITTIPEDKGESNDETSFKNSKSVSIDVLEEHKVGCNTNSNNGPLHMETDTNEIDVLKHVVNLSKDTSDSDVPEFSSATLDMENKGVKDSSQSELSVIRTERNVKENMLESSVTLNLQNHKNIVKDVTLESFVSDKDKHEEEENGGYKGDNVNSGFKVNSDDDNLKCATALLTEDNCSANVNDCENKSLSIKDNICRSIIVNLPVTRETVIHDDCVKSISVCASVDSQISNSEDDKDTVKTVVENQSDRHVCIEETNIKALSNSTESNHSSLTDDQSSINVTEIVHANRNRLLADEGVKKFDVSSDMSNGKSNLLNITETVVDSCMVLSGNKTIAECKSVEDSRNMKSEILQPAFDTPCIDLSHSADNHKELSINISQDSGSDKAKDILPDDRNCVERIVEESVLISSSKEEAYGSENADEYIKSCSSPVCLPELLETDATNEKNDVCKKDIAENYNSPSNENDPRQLNKSPTEEKYEDCIEKIALKEDNHPKTICRIESNSIRSECNNEEDFDININNKCIDSNCLKSKCCIHMSDHKAVFNPENITISEDVAEKCNQDKFINIRNSDTTKSEKLNTELRKSSLQEPENCIEFDSANLLHEDGLSEKFKVKINNKSSCFSSCNKPVTSSIENIKNSICEKDNQADKHLSLESLDEVKTNEYNVISNSQEQSGTQKVASPSNHHLEVYCEPESVLENIDKDSTECLPDTEIKSHSSTYVEGINTITTLRNMELFIPEDITCKEVAIHASGEGESLSNSENAESISEEERSNTNIFPNNKTDDKQLTNLSKDSTSKKVTSDINKNTFYETGITDCEQWVPQLITKLVKEPVEINKKTESKINNDADNHETENDNLLPLSIANEKKSHYSKSEFNSNGSVNLNRFLKRDQLKMKNRKIRQSKILRFKQYARKSTKISARKRFIGRIKKCTSKNDRLISKLNLHMSTVSHESRFIKNNKKRKVILRKFTNEINRCNFEIGDTKLNSILETTHKDDTKNSVPLIQDRAMETDECQSIPCLNLNNATAIPHASDSPKKSNASSDLINKDMLNDKNEYANDSVSVSENLIKHDCSSNDKKPETFSSHELLDDFVVGKTVTKSNDNVPNYSSDVDHCTAHSEKEEEGSKSANGRDYSAECVPKKRKQILLENDSCQSLNNTSEVVKRKRKKELAKSQEQIDSSVGKETSYKVLNNSSPQKNDIISVDETVTKSNDIVPDYQSDFQSVISTIDSKVTNSDNQLSTSVSVKTSDSDCLSSDSVTDCCKLDTLENTSASVLTNESIFLENKRAECISNEENVEDISVPGNIDDNSKQIPNNSIHEEDSMCLFQQYISKDQKYAEKEIVVNNNVDILPENRSVAIMDVMNCSSEIEANSNIMSKEKYGDFTYINESKPLPVINVDDSNSIVIIIEELCDSESKVNSDNCMEGKCIEDSKSVCKESDCNEEKNTEDSKSVCKESDCNEEKNTEDSKSVCKESDCNEEKNTDDSKSVCKEDDCNERKDSDDSKSDLTMNANEIDNKSGEKIETENSICQNINKLSADNLYEEKHFVTDVLDEFTVAEVEVSTNSCCEMSNIHSDDSSDEDFLGYSSYHYSCETLNATNSSNECAISGKETDDMKEDKNESPFSHRKTLSHKYTQGKDVCSKSESNFIKEETFADKENYKSVSYEASSGGTEPLLRANNKFGHETNDNFKEILKRTEDEDRRFDIISISPTINNKNYSKFEDTNKLCSKPVIKCSLPWERVFNTTNSKKRKMLRKSRHSLRQGIELGPAKIELRVGGSEEGSDEVSCMETSWKVIGNSPLSANSNKCISPVVKVRRLILQRDPELTSYSEDSACSSKEYISSSSDEDGTHEKTKKQYSRFSSSASSSSASSGSSHRINFRRSSSVSSTSSISNNSSISSSSSHVSSTLTSASSVPKVLIKKMKQSEYKSFLKVSHTFNKPVVKLIRCDLIDSLALKNKTSINLCNKVMDDVAVEKNNTPVATDTVEMTEDGVENDSICSENCSHKLFRYVPYHDDKSITDCNDGNFEVCDIIHDNDIHESLSYKSVSQLSSLSKSAFYDCDISVENNDDSTQESALSNTPLSSVVKEFNPKFGPEDSAPSSSSSASVTASSIFSRLESDGKQIDLDDVNEMELKNCDGCEADRINRRVALKRPPDELSLENESSTKRRLPKDVTKYMFHCQRCLLVFNNKEEVISHQAAMHPTHQELHHCMLCQRSFSTLARHTSHIQSRSHRRLELLQRCTIHAMHRYFTGRDCPRLCPLTPAELKSFDWRPNQPGCIHFYHHPSPLQLALEENPWGMKRKLNNERFSSSSSSSSCVSSQTVSTNHSGSTLPLSKSPSLPPHINLQNSDSCFT